MSEGTKVTIGKKDYILLPMNFKALRQAADSLPKLVTDKSIYSEEKLDALIKVLAAALQKNNPDITEEFLINEIEGDQVSDIFTAIASTFPKKKVTEPAPETANSTSTGSQPS